MKEDVMFRIAGLSRKLGTFIITGALVAGVSGIMLARQASAADLQGPIESINPDGSLVVNGQTLFVNGQTEIEGTLAVGAIIEAEVTAQGDGSLLALEIGVSDTEEANEDD